MTNQPSPPDNFSMQRGFELYRNGKPYAALVHFNFFMNLQPVSEEVVIAMEMSGQIFREIGQLDPSLICLSNALKEVERLNAPTLKASIENNLEATVTARRKSRRHKGEEQPPAS